jgi:hypothetical protein
MSATEMVGTGIEMPRIEIVEPGEDRHVIVTWAEGARRGRKEGVDLSPLIETHRFYRPLRENDALFQSVHLIDDGAAIAWGEDESLDMAATSVERLAEEAMTADEFTNFLKRNKLTHRAAAAALGRSRRQIEYYLTSGFIPRTVVLACYGYEARRKIESHQ